MRAPWIAAIAAVVVLGACGNSDRAPEVAAEESPSDTRSLEELVDAALLRAADLGEPWQLTDEHKQGPIDDKEAIYADCWAQRGFADRYRRADPILSDERTFNRDVDADGRPMLPEVKASSVVTDPDLIDEIEALYESKAFSDCFSTKLSELMAAEGSRVGEAVATDLPVTNTDIRVVSFEIPITVHVGDTTLEMTSTDVFISRDKIGSYIHVYGERGAVPRDELTRWAERVGERLLAA